jgi:myosin heavy subunit
VEGEASIPESLLAAKTLQEVEAIVARVFSSDGGSSAASGSTFNGSIGGSATAGIGVSRLSGTGTRDSMPGAEDVAAEAHLAAELHRYKQQVQELQEAKDALQAEALLASAKAEDVAALQAANEQLVLQINLLNQAAEHASSGQQQQAELLQQLEALKAANTGLDVGKQELVSSLQDLQVQLEQLQQERERLLQQNARLRWLEEELLDLQLQIADLVQQNKDLAAELAAAKLQQLAKAGMFSDASMQSQATSDSAAAVSAVRAATQSLMQVSSRCCRRCCCCILLHLIPVPIAAHATPSSSPLPCTNCCATNMTAALQLEVGTEQLMLPSTDSDTPKASQLATRKPGQEHGSAGAGHQIDSVLQPLREPLSSAMLPDQPMAQMLSSEHNEDRHSRPFSAEMETEVSGAAANLQLVQSDPHARMRVLAVHL